MLIGGVEVPVTPIKLTIKEVFRKSPNFYAEKV